MKILTEEILSELVKKFKIKASEMAYIGDHPKDVIEAKKAGVVSIAVPTGFHSKKELKSENPDILVDDLNDLVKII